MWISQAKVLVGGRAHVHLDCTPPHLQVGYEDAGRVRPVLHRMSLVEMAVPYGDPNYTQVRVLCVPAYLHVLHECDCLLTARGRSRLCRKIQGVQLLQRDEYQPDKRGIKQGL